MANKMKAKRGPLARFYFDVLKNSHYDENSCLMWDGAKQQGGYGVICRKIDGKAKTLLTHRISYEYHYGEIPEGHEMDHICRVTGCFRHEHLRAIPKWAHVRIPRGKRLSRDIVFAILAMKKAGMSKRDAETAIAGLTFWQLRNIWEGNAYEHFIEEWEVLNAVKDSKNVNRVTK